MVFYYLMCTFCPDFKQIAYKSLLGQVSIGVNSSGVDFVGSLLGVVGTSSVILLKL